jgi:hypothetical protein
MIVVLVVCCTGAVSSCGVRRCSIVVLNFVRGFELQICLYRQPVASVSLQHCLLYSIHAGILMLSDVLCRVAMCLYQCVSLLL